MISRAGNKNFLAAHYDWLALAVGLLALAAGAALYVVSLGSDPAEEAAGEVARIERLKPSANGVRAVDMSDYQGATRLTKTPQRVAELKEGSESFLASERRVLCTKCAKAIPGDPKACPKCPYCGEPQQPEKEVVLDADGDGMPDEWEKKYGLNVNDPADAAADADGDAFTNLEEFLAKTDPTNKDDHPDYLDSLKIVLPLKQTSMPFVFRKANKIPSGWRCEFFDPVRKDDYGRTGTTLTAVTGEAIADTGFVLKSFTEKTAKEAIKGSELMKTVDASEVVVVRKSDGKAITLVTQHGKSVKLAPVDVQATLSYTRGETKTFDVVPGQEIALSGAKYRIFAITAAGEGAKVTVENVLDGKKRTLVAP